MATYVNPLRSIRGLQMGRTDQGVDATGTGPVLAMGSGKVLETSNSGWPGGGYIVIALDNPISGHGAYYTAEDITPTVQVGQRVKAGQQIGTAFAGSSGLELGWAGTGAALGESLAMATTGYTEGQATSAGASFKSVLDALMAGKQPAGGSSSASSASSGATNATLTSATQGGAAAGTGGCMITLIAWPVLIPWALISNRNRARRRTAPSAGRRGYISRRTAGRTSSTCQIPPADVPGGGRDNAETSSYHK